MNGDQAQHYIDEATNRVFDKGIENATTADLMFFGFGYLAHVIEKSRPRSLLQGKKLLPVGAGLGAGFAWIVENILLPVVSR